MKQGPKTVKGYIKALKRLADIITSELKGYDKLTKEDKENLMFTDGELNNAYGELQHILNK